MSCDGVTLQLKFGLGFFEMFGAVCLILSALLIFLFIIVVEFSFSPIGFLYIWLERNKRIFKDTEAS